ncbi:MAG: rod shape-determining protein MreC [bacterium]|nr:rod shape-determining protein MreC [bacterium]
MAALNTSRQNVIILIALLFLQLLLMASSARGTNASKRLEGWLNRLSSPVVVVADWGSGAVADAFSSMSDLIDAHRRNAALATEVGDLRSEVEGYREAYLENERLRRLLGMRDHLAPVSIAASVVTSVVSEQEQMIVIDRGLSDGLRTDLPVVAWGGAVGRVVSVGPGHAKVRLLSDPNSGVAGLVQRSRAQGMIFGLGRHPLALRSLDLRYVPRFSDVAVGDRVVTSGLDGIFPRGFAVGRVISVVEPPDGSQIIRLAPQLNYAAVEEVLVLLDGRGAELLAGPQFPQGRP